MRPINLIPADQRRDRGSSRTGPLAYIVVGGLFALLAGVVVMVLASNQISERESQLTRLEAQRDVAQTRADRLAPYVKFQQVQRQRTETISELADSRFDWPRVVRQLSLILPKYVVLTKLTGDAGGGSGGGATGGSSLASAVKGPSLTLEGCAASQKRVAALVASLRHIDGVTRVGLSSSAREIRKGDASSSGSSECLPENAAFTVAVAFDAAPPSPDSASATEPVAAAAPEESSAASEAAPAESESSDGTKTTVSKTTTVTPPSN